jgi:hypothetical protein
VARPRRYVLTNIENGGGTFVFRVFFLNLDGKSKVGYREKVTSIAKDDPYMLKKDDFTTNVSFLPDLR